ncbi:MAG: DNA gyrase/topoisomerase IV subunit A [Cyclobacteriaceae bacterium]
MSEEITDLTNDFSDNSSILPVSGMYKNWFLEYASYVILERAVPAIEDGFKPVQRRIVHSMKEMDDGRFNKVANVIGHTMQYHPHGDAAIGDAIVNLGQKDLLIETQGNWGDIRTGDRAAAPRYIEARLSKFANAVVFNPQTTTWQASYDGRKKEPITLPVKFPLLLAQGVEGIAVGLATKIMPHNFCELIDASIAILKGKKVNIMPDFPAGGTADFSNYNEGQKGGKIRVRSSIEIHDKKTLLVKDVPYGTTTNSLIDSIIKANDTGKIKIKKVTDNTAKEVEIEVQLASGVSPEQMIDALYAFTDCEVSISPNACVIIDEKPHFISVNEILKLCTDKTLVLLESELEIKKRELLEKILFSSLEKIFIENRIYRDIEECETWEAVLETIDRGLDPFKPDFYREITQEDIIRLTEIKIKRISKFDAFKANELMNRLEEELKQVEHNLANLIEFAVDYYKDLLAKFGKGKERKTQIKTFGAITATRVAVANQKLYVNREEGFVGYGLKKDEYIGDCSDIDDIIAFMEDGKMVVSKVADKVFVGKKILYAGVFKKGDDRMVYHAIYRDGKLGKTMAKRFQVLGVTRDKQYDLTKGTKGSKILFFSANPNGESEIVTINLSSNSKARVKAFDYNFAELAIKGRGAGGNTLTKHAVRKVVFKEKGVSTLGGIDIYYDETVGRLNKDERGILLGSFNGDDKIVVIRENGECRLTDFDLSNHYNEDKIALIERYDETLPVSMVYYDGENKTSYVKRFAIENTATGKTTALISAHKMSKVLFVTTKPAPKVNYVYLEGTKNAEEKIELENFIDVKGWKAQGNKLTEKKVKKVTLEDWNKEAEQAREKELKPGDTIDLDITPPGDQDQLGLF